MGAGHLEYERFAAVSRLVNGFRLVDKNRNAEPRPQPFHRDEVMMTQIQHVGDVFRRKLLGFPLKIPVLLIHQMTQSFVANHREAFAASAFYPIPGGRPLAIFEPCGFRSNSFTSPAIIDQNSPVYYWVLCDPAALAAITLPVPKLARSPATRLDSILRSTSTPRPSRPPTDDVSFAFGRVGHSESQCGPSQK